MTEPASNCPNLVSIFEEEPKKTRENENLAPNFQAEESAPRAALRFRAHLATMARNIPKPMTAIETIRS